MIDLSSAGPQRGSGSSSTPKITSNSLHFVDSSTSYFSSGSTVPSQHEADIKAAGGGESSSFTPSFLKTARHPLICIFHLLFKALALIAFLLGSFIFGGWGGDYVFTFVTTTVFLSMDFWTVKNITGRLLVGMRWWNHIKDDGTSEWMYEAHTDERVINLTDKTVFWTALYLWPLTWLAFFIIYFFRFQVEWVLLVAIGLTLSGANLVGYWKCSKEAKKRVEEWATTTAFKAVFGRFF